MKQPYFQLRMVKGDSTQASQRWPALKRKVVLLFVMPRAMTQMDRSVASRGFVITAAWYWA